MRQRFVIECEVDLRRIAESNDRVHATLLVHLQQHVVPLDGDDPFHEQEGLVHGEDPEGQHYNSVPRL